ncbi:MAG TPA: hypothetical protein PLB81_02385 [Deltaproteobacteria bacterium]|nr:hypothetical protein [Deltaproteobacteria bacterium]
MATLASIDGWVTVALITGTVTVTDMPGLFRLATMALRRREV